MRDNTVSICMATYNGAEHIKEQIESILPYLSENDELLFSDDGSTDGTREYLNELEKESRIVRVIDGPQKGASANFFSVIRAATKEIIFISDQDDVWNETKIDDVCSMFHSKPNAMVVLHEDIIKYEIDGKEVPCNQLKHGFWRNLIRSSYSGHRMAMKSTFRNKIGNVDDKCESYDQYLGLLAEKNKCAEFLHKKLDIHIMHGNNVTRRLTIVEKIKLRWNLIECILMK